MKLKDLPKWSKQYLEQKCTRKEKRSFINILKKVGSFLSTFTIGQYLSLKLNKNLSTDDSTELAYKVGSHLMNEDKVMFYHRSQTWALKENEVEKD